MKPAIAGLLLLVLSCKLTVGLADDALDRARDAIAAGQHAQALALLLPMEDARAGDPDFDMLLGRAALGGRELEVAVLHLEGRLDDGHELFPVDVQEHLRVGRKPRHKVSQETVTTNRR